MEQVDQIPQYEIEVNFPKKKKKLFFIKEWFNLDFLLLICLYKKAELVERSLIKKDNDYEN